MYEVGRARPDRVGSMTNWKTVAGFLGMGMQDTTPEDYEIADSVFTTDATF